VRTHFAIGEDRFAIGEDRFAIGEDSVVCSGALCVCVCVKLTRCSGHNMSRLRPCDAVFLPAKHSNFGPPQ